MPQPGFVLHQQNAIESNLPIVGTILTDMYYQIPPATYNTGSINAQTLGTVTGSIVAAVITLNKIGIIDQVGVVGVSEDTGSIIGARVVGWGKQLGSLVGTTVAATIIADTNTVLVQLYYVGTITGTLSTSNALPKTLVPGTTTKGTIQFAVRGV